MICACGDAEDEHGGDPEYPGRTACIFNDPKTAEEADREVCPCESYEWDGEDDENED